MSSLTHPSLRWHGTGAPLIYVPGIDGTGELFFSQIPRLAPTHRVATYRLRDSAEHMDELVHDLADVVRQTSPSGEPATLVAESFGGALALNFALVHPELAKSLVVLNSFASYHVPWQLQVAIGGLKLLPWEFSRWLQQFSAERLHSASTARADIERAQSLRGASTREGYLNRLRMLAAYDVREQLGRLETPTLFLAGDRDALIPSVQQAHFMAGRAPDASVKVLQGHGHAALLAPEVDIGALLAEWTKSRSHVGGDVAQVPLPGNG